MSAIRSWVLRVIWSWETQDHEFIQVTGELEMPALAITNKKAAVLTVLENHNFRAFFVAQTFSVMGTWMQVTALGWLIYRLSGSAFLVATLVFLNQIPVLFLSPWAGVLADRFDRRKLLMVTQSTSFFLNFFLAMLVLRQQADMRWILALVAGGGVIYALDLPARQAFLCDLVGPAQVRGAVILNSLGFHLARMTGPVLA
jgi:MFS family permease